MCIKWHEFGDVKWKRKHQVLPLAIFRLEYFLASLFVYLTFALYKLSHSDMFCVTSPSVFGDPHQTSLSGFYLLRQENIQGQIW